MMDNLPIPPRPGVFPGLYFPMGFTPVNYDRQNIMTPDFVADTNQHNAVKGIWAYGLNRPFDSLSKEKLDGIFNSVKRDVDKIKAKGRSGSFCSDAFQRIVLGKRDELDYPRAEFWDRLLRLYRL